MYDIGEFTLFKRMKDDTIKRHANDQVYPEQELHEFEEKFSAAFHASPNLMAITRFSDGMILEVNEGYERLLGYSRVESIGKTTGEMSIWADAKDRAIFVAKLTEFGQVTDFETKLRRKDGSLLTVLDSARIIELQGEKCILSVVHDISERKWSEDILEARARLLLFANKHTLDELLEETLNEVEKLTGSLIGFYHFVDPDQNSLTLQNWSTRTKKEFCKAGGKGSHYAIAEAGVWVDCVHQRKPVIHNDYAALTHKKGLPPGHANVVRELVVPVMRGDKIVAILGVGNKPSDYDERDIKTVSFFADLAWDIAEPKRAEEALKKSEERFRRLAENAQDVIYRMSLPDGKYEYMSPAALSVFGYSPEECYENPKFIKQIMHPDWSGYFEDQWENLIKGNVPPTYEYQIIHKSGEVRWVNQRNILVRDSEGKPVAIEGIVTDITQRKKVESELVDVNRSLRMVSEVNQALIHIEDEEKLLNETCRIAVEIGGYRMAWVGFAEHDEAKTVRVAAKMGFEEGYLEKANITWADTERGRGPTGVAIRTGEVRISRNMWEDPEAAPWREQAMKRGYRSSIALPLMDNGYAFGALNIYSDKVDAFSEEEVKILKELAGDLAFGVTDRRMRNERKVMESELTKLKKAVDTSGEVIFMTDREGIFTFVNPEFTHLYGHAAADIIGKATPRILKSGLIAAETYELFWEKLLAKQIVKGDHVNKTKDGRLLIIESSVNPVLDEQGEILGFLAIQRDITERKHTEERLRELDMLKDKFIQTVSHQMRTPLSVIRWQLENLLEGEHGKLNDYQEQLARSCYQADLDVITRVNDFLTALEIEEGLMPRLDKTPNCLESLWKSVEIKFREDCALKKIVFESDMPKISSPLMEIDMEKIRFVMEKLADNALIYTNKEGSIKVTIRQVNTNVRFEIRDTGVGIPDLEQPHIFTRFYRASNVGVMKPDASGLSLFIAKHFIQAHEGTIGFTSEEGKGSTFWFELPYHLVVE